MSDMLKCDPEVFEHGEAVLMIHLSSKGMEKWIRLVRADLAKRPKELSKETKVDWSYMGGRAIVKDLGDVWAAFRSIRRHLPELLTAQKSEDSKYDCYEGPSYRFLGEFAQ